MICQHCGHENADGAKFCAGCGSKLAQAPAPVEPTGTAAPITIEPIFVDSPAPAPAAAPAAEPAPEPEAAPEAAPTQVIEPAPTPEPEAAPAPEAAPTQVLQQPTTPMAPAAAPVAAPVAAPAAMPEATQQMPYVPQTAPTSPVAAPPAPPVPGAPASPVAGGSAPEPKKGPNKTVIAIIGAIVVAAIVIFGIFPKLFGGSEPTNVDGSGTGIVNGGTSPITIDGDEGDSSDETDAKIDAYIGSIDCISDLDVTMYDDEATVVVTGIGKDFEGDTGYLMEVTNNTNEDIYLVCGSDAELDGRSIEPICWRRIKPGATKTTFLYFDEDDYEVTASSSCSTVMGILGSDEDTILATFDFEIDGTEGGSTTSTTGTAPQGTVNGKAAGTYYAVWHMGDGLGTWTYTVILNDDGTGIFRLGSFDDTDFSKADVDALTYREDFIWTQEGDTVIFYNPEGQEAGMETWPDAPQSYKVTGTDGSRKLMQADPDTYHYPSEDFFESFDEAKGAMDD